MMTNSMTKAYNDIKATSKMAAEVIQTKADDMTSAELYNQKKYIPDFVEACKRKNMLERPIGFVCKSSAGRVVRLLQPYDSTVFTQEPEELTAQWGFKWSKNPEEALPFVSIATSPYMIDECCIDEDKVYRSTINNNVNAPSAYPQGWVVVADE